MWPRRNNPAGPSSFGRTLSRPVVRWRAHGENGLLDHSSRPTISPARTAEDT
ncbi:hypothetical protein GKQ77_01695 [Streptomyces sp. BG9H]|uniref:Uncharacterized protein n=1 Tax=Streptomyces anatolicus TaxID=2675858 RepID=A0ABS6YFV1_9ACTN|nr:hypothetical protein [Streptomyces anatolicus]